MRLFTNFAVGDSLKGLCGIWAQIIQNPTVLADGYAALWEGQLAEPIPFFNRVREEFNRDGDPAKLLFLLARCVKNAVRFNPSGHFNQSADKRRLGTKPRTMRAELLAAHAVLGTKATLTCTDFATFVEDI